MAGAQDNMEITFSDATARVPEVDTEPSDALAEDGLIYPASLSSSISEYLDENGRRCPTDRFKNYMIPNDLSVTGPLDLMHEMFRLRLDGNRFLAPVQNPGSILDIGTGTGAWAMDVGDTYEDAIVIATDIGATHHSWFPPNVKFKVEDANGRWTFPKPFDFIHCRWMAAGIQDWPEFVKQAFHFTKPGGWVEFQDLDMDVYSLDGTFDRQGPFAQWIRDCCSAIESFGRTLSPGPKLEEWVRAAGFTDVVHKKFRLPIGVWPKDDAMRQIGAINFSQLDEALEDMSIKVYTELKGWTPEDTWAFLSEVKKDLRRPEVHSMYNFHVVYARRPTSMETHAVHSDQMLALLNAMRIG